MRLFHSPVRFSLLAPAALLALSALVLSAPRAANAQDLFVANLDNNTISRVTPGGVVSLFASGFSGAYGLAFDTGGNLFVANNNGNTVSRVTPGGAVSPFASGFSGPVGLAFAPTAVAAPEPGSLALLGMGLVSGMGTLGIARRKRTRSTAA